MAQFTAAEAAFVLREPIRAVKKALDAGPVPSMLRRKSGASVRVIDWSGLLYLYAAKELREELTPKARNEFYAALQASLTAHVDEVRVGYIRIAISDFLPKVEDRTAALATLARGIEFSEGGEPLLKGTAIEVHRIAALLDGGMSVDDILTDYPSLSRDAVEIAAAYAAVHPKSGRPYPRTTAKRALRASGLDALDEVLGDPAE